MTWMSESEAKATRRDRQWAEAEAGSSLQRAHSVAVDPKEQ